jgi:methyl-accepting chemotaxis protein
MGTQRVQGEVKFGIKLKFIVLISGICISMGLILGIYFLTRAKSSLEEQFQSRGLSLAKNIAFDSLYGLAIEDTVSLQRIAKAMEREPDVSYVIIMDASRKVMAHTDSQEVGKILSDDLTKNVASSKGVSVISYASGGQDLYDIGYPVVKSSEQQDDLTKQFEGERLGTVRVGISLSSIREKVQNLIWMTVVLVVVVISLGIVFSVFFVRIMVNPIEKMAAAAVRLSEGDFTEQLTFNSHDEIGILGNAFGQMSTSLKGMIRRVQDVAGTVTAATEQMLASTKKVSEGSGKQAKAAEETSASVQQMNMSINNIAENIESLSHSAEVTSSSLTEMSVSVNQVANNTVSLASSAEDTSASLLEMSTSIRNVVDNVNQLSTASEETATSVNEMSASIREVEQNAKQSAVLSEKVSQDAQEFGMRSIEKTIEGMERIRKMVDRSAEVINKLGQKTEHIGKILTVIDEVTRQTNLLALNAAILAAQAGEQGKGFTVVADEIKNLADRTASSTKEISQLILNVQTEAKDAVISIKDGLNSVEEGMQLSLEAKEALKKILESSQKSSQMGRGIEGATVEQVKAIRQVMESTQKVNMMIQQIVRAMQEQSRGTEQITRASENIRGITRQVKTSTEEQAKGTQQISESAENISTRIQQIYGAIQEQKKGSDVIMNSVVEIRQVAQVSVDMVTQMSQLMHDLMKQTELLKGEVARFKIA